MLIKILLKRVRHGASGEPWNFYLWFAYEFCLLTLEYQAKHRLEFSNGEQFTIGRSFENLL
ncbi:hypothetical protein HMPREF9554_00588 [Treponema phagedenis F0421]|nr:hypothetical protein HMPREF9554_00588 [Treponema phagedenis F0421]